MKGGKRKETAMITGDAAPEWDVASWLNTDTPLSLQELRGSVVVVHAFQMLCPGCVSHGIPQAKAIHQTFPPGRVQVVGLHTVFEHHAAMGEVALRAFLHEYRIHFPVGIDRADPHGNPIPLTMQAWRMQGTPTLFILDEQGRIRLHHFGRLDDLRVGAVIGQLLAELDATAQ
jgi:peroxiredoxin